MTFHAPQIILCALILMGAGISLVKHGDPCTGKHNFFFDIFASAIYVSLLWWGGFFSQP